MPFLRLHWFDVGLGLAVVVGMLVLITHPTGLTLLLWLSLLTLFLHQGEEYRFPGYFPGMINSALFSSQHPDRYPLNMQSALVVNVPIGWLFYFLAAVLGEKAMWLGIATIIVSVGNIFGHAVLFNLKGKTWYNPGLLTALLLFLPLSVAFFMEVLHQHTASLLDWIVGLTLGIALNYIGIVKVIEWMKDATTPYIFPARFLIPNATRNADGTTMSKGARS